MNRKRFEEIAKLKGKKVLYESTVINVKSEDIETYDKPLFVESSDGNSIQCRGILKNVPISKYTENDNNRIYSRKLWENVYNSKVSEGTLSLMDHPEDEGSVKDVCGVWKNMRLGENYVFADWYLIGDNGQLILEVVNAGGKIGISSVGYGEFLEDNKTVNPDTYELERLGDAVLNPSQNVYATKQNLQNQVEENKQNKENYKKDQFFEDSFTNNIDKNINVFSNEKNKLEVHTMDRITEANFKNHVLALIREAKKIENLTESIDTLKRIDTAGDDFLTSKVEEAISEVQAKLEEQKNSAEKNLASVTAELNELKAKYEVACQTLTQLKENYSKAKSVIEKMGLKDDKEVGNVINESRKIKKQIEIFKENKRRMINDIKQLLEDRKNMFSDLRALVEDRKLMKADIKQLIEDRKNMLSDIKIFLTKYKKLKKKYVEHLKKINEEDDEEKEDDMYEFSFDDDKEDIENSEQIVAEQETDEMDIEKDNFPEEDEEIEFPDENEENEIVEGEGEEVELSNEDEDNYEDELSEEDDEVVIDDEENNEDNVISEEDEEFENENEEDIISEDDENNEENTEDEEIILPEEDEEEIVDNDEDNEVIVEEDEDENNEEEIINDEDIIEEDDEIDNEDFDDDFEEKQPVVEKKKIIKSEINKLYAIESKNYPALKNIKKYILKSNSVVEAVQKINKFKDSRKNKNTKPVKMTESTKNQELPDWLQGRW